MTRPRRRDVPVRMLFGRPIGYAQHAQEQSLIAIGPMRLKDGSWRGCRHFIPDLPGGQLGPEAHEHEGENA